MEEEKFTIEVTISKRWKNVFCSFLKQLEHNGIIGHSSQISIYADGDGDFNPKFNINTEFETVKGFPKENLGDKAEMMYDAG